MSSLQYVPMSYDQWQQLPEKPKAEWVDGVAVIGVPPVFDHGYVQTALSVALITAFPSLRVVTEVFVVLPHNRVRIPDISVVDHRPEGGMITDPPVLVVEVLSPSTRGEDTIRKSTEYAGAGIGQYWIVDPDLRSLDIYRNVDGGWEPLARLDDHSPTATVEVEHHGTVDLDLATLLDG
ncbi:MAG: Uma2 family endonuclease [Nocardioidaceae bacterium]